MSKSTVEQVIQRAVSDAAFRRQLQRDPGAALKGFDLSADERAAITSGDPSRLTGLGVDQRMSKAFVLGELVHVAHTSPANAIDVPFVDEKVAGIVGDPARPDLSRFDPPEVIMGSAGLEAPAASTPNYAAFEPPDVIMGSAGLEAPAASTPNYAAFEPPDVIMGSAGLEAPAASTPNYAAFEPPDVIMGDASLAGDSSDQTGSTLDGGDAQGDLPIQN